jgi:uncharacterized protein DUF1905
MSDEIRFRGHLEGARGGGHVIAVDETLAASIGAKHMTRVRGTVAGADYRSNLVKMRGTMYLGVHKATIERAGVGDDVDVTARIDPGPREPA